MESGRMEGGLGLVSVYDFIKCCVGGPLLLNVCLSSTTGIRLCQALCQTV